MTATERRQQIMDLAGRVHDLLAQEHPSDALYALLVNLQALLDALNQCDPPPEVKTQIDMLSLPGEMFLRGGQKVLFPEDNCQPPARQKETTPGQ
jgi:hypothetical protein